MLSALQPFIYFVFGEIHKALLTVILFWSINFIFAMFNVKEIGWKKLLADEGRKLLAYAAFIMVANRLDDLAVDALFGWKGSTQFLVSLGLMAREATSVLANVAGSNVEVPNILGRRLTQLEDGDVDPSSDYVEPHLLDKKIADLERDLDKIKKLRRLEEEARGDSSTYFYDDPF